MLQIIGTGIMGMSLAHLAESRGIPFTLFDREAKGASWHASALINPINLRNYKAIPEFSLKTIQGFYGTYLRPYPMVHVFRNIEDRIVWEQSSKNHPSSWWLDPPPLSPGFHIPHGSIGFQGAYKLDWHGYHGVFAPLVHRISTIKDLPPIQAGGLRVWCIGYPHEPEDQRYFNTEWPRFDWKCARGEYLIVRMDQGPSQAVHGGFFLEPLGGDIFRFGSTYDWDLSISGPSSRGLELLQVALKQLYLGPWTILDHQGVIRPILAQRTPQILVHQERPEVFVAGLGARGFSHAPTLASEIIHIYHNYP